LCYSGTLCTSSSILVLYGMGGFYQWSREHPEGAYRELWGLVTDIRNLRCAWRTVATNKGKRTPGIDGVTVNATA